MCEKPLRREPHFFKDLTREYIPFQISEIESSKEYQNFKIFCKQFEKRREEYTSLYFLILLIASEHGIPKFYYQNWEYIANPSFFLAGLIGKSSLKIAKTIISDGFAVHLETARMFLFYFHRDYFSDKKSFKNELRTVNCPSPLILLISPKYRKLIRELSIESDPKIIFSPKYHELVLGIMSRCLFQTSINVEQLNKLVKGMPPQQTSSTRRCHTRILQSRQQNGFVLPSLRTSQQFSNQYPKWGEEITPARRKEIKHKKKDMLDAQRTIASIESKNNFSKL